MWPDVSGTNHNTASDWFTPRRFSIVLLAALAAAFPKIVLGLESWFFRDYGVLGYPALFFHREAFWRGEIPLWNPLSNCGAPFLAQWGTMALYPGSLVYLLFPMPWSLSYFCLGHLFLAGLGMYWLARRWTGNGFAAAAAGFAFVFNGATFSCLLWPNYTVALGWMPWVVLTAERAWTEGGRKVLVAGVVAAMQLLSGVPEIILLTWLAVIGLWLACGRQTNPWPRSLSRLALAVVIAAGLVAAQIFPFLDLLAHSHRDPGFAPVKWSMPGWGWANLIAPLFHCFESPLGIFFQPEQAFLSSYYPGVIVLALAIWGGLAAGTARARVMAVLTVLALIMALGPNGFLYSLVRGIFPALGLMRFPVKFVLLATFLMPLLTAMALGWWERSCASTSSTGRWLLPGLTWLAVAVAMAGIIWFGRAHPFEFDQPDVMTTNTLVRLGFFTALMVLLAGFCLDGIGALIVRWLWLVLLVLDVITHVPWQNPSLPVEHFKPGLWAMANKMKAPRHGEGRVMITPAAEDKLTHSMVADAAANWTGKRLALWSNLNLLEGIPKVNGSSTLQLRPQREIEDMIYKQGRTNCPGLLDFLGVRLITAPQNVVEWVERPSALPLVTAGQQPAWVGGTQALAAVFAPDFDPKKVVYLPAEIESRTTARKLAQPKQLEVRHEAQRLTIQIDTPEPSWVVIAQSYAPQWRAYVDGRQTGLFRANHAFQALEVPAGRHRVEVVYKDYWFYAGAGVSLITLMVCLLAGWQICLRRRQQAMAGDGARLSSQ